MRNMQGKRGFMAIKIDLEKAYDRVNWNFLRACLVELNLPGALIDIIYACVSTPNMQLLWNGEKAGSINPSRGVRQGDPLSPYLFVLCMEKLAHLIQEQINHGAWKAINLCKNGPPISHLFFADDIVLFVEASLHQSMVVKSCLDQFCEASGLKVNTSKTRVFFSKNVSHARRTELCTHLNFQVTPDLGKYLGVPLHHERVTKRSYQTVVDKVRKRLSSWKIHTLSIAGRSTLVSSVTSTIPGYTMQTALLPSGVCDEIEKQNRGFLWGSTMEQRKTHLVNWETVCKTKKNGGLGLKHIRSQNQAYMAKLGWNLMKRKDDLWVRVVRSKYRCGNDLVPIIDATRPGSNIWSGIKKAWEVVHKGTIVDYSKQTICWKHDRHGEFSIRTAYQAIEKEENVSNMLWQRIWKLHIIPRCKTFMWVTLHNKLLTNEERYRRGLSTDRGCSWCGAESENVLHVLRDCPETRKLWMELVDPMRIHRFMHTDLETWLRLNLQRETGTRKEDWNEMFSTLCWLIWQRRNKRIFESLVMSNDSLKAKSRCIIDATTQARSRLRGVNLTGQPVQTRVDHWKRPEMGWMKVNVDGACSEGRNSACGGILRDDQGKLRIGFMYHDPAPTDSFKAELWATLLGLKMCWDHGVRRLILETDSLEVTTMLARSHVDAHPDASMLEEVKAMLDRDWEVSIRHIPREANMVADYVAKQALNIVSGYQPFSSPFGNLIDVMTRDSIFCSDVNHGLV